MLAFEMGWRMSNSMKISLLPLAFIALFATGCANSDAILKVKDPGLSTARMIRIIRNHTNVTETASFWSDIANNAIYDEDKRSIAIFQLFKRHFRPGMTLGELRSLLGSPSWLTETHFYVHLIGKGPSWQFDPDTSDACLKPWIKPDIEGAPSIYMEIDGKIESDDIISYFMTGRSSNAVALLKIKRIESFEWSDPPDGNELVNEWGLHDHAIRPSTARKRQN